MKLLTVTYNSLLWSLLLATFLFNYTWLQMRVNIGYLFFALWLVLIILWELALRRRQVKPGFTVVSALLTIAIALLVEGRENLLIIPAAFIREGLHLESISFTSINLVLAVIIIGGFLVSLFRLLKSH